MVVEVGDGCPVESGREEPFCEPLTVGCVGRLWDRSSEDDGTQCAAGDWSQRSMWRWQCKDREAG